MREMSASAQQTTTFSVPTGVTVSDPVPDAAIGNPRVGEAQAAAATATVAPPTPIVTAAAAHPDWRLAIGGFVLLIVATGLACAIPHFHLKGGIGEYALVLLSIIALFAGASM